METQQPQPLDPAVVQAAAAELERRGYTREQVEDALTVKLLRETYLARGVAADVAQRTAVAVVLAQRKALTDPYRPDASGRLPGEAQS